MWGKLCGIVRELGVMMKVKVTWGNFGNTRQDQRGLIWGEVIPGDLAIAMKQHYCRMHVGHFQAYRNTREPAWRFPALASDNRIH